MYFFDSEKLALQLVSTEFLANYTSKIINVNLSTLIQKCKSSWVAIVNSKVYSMLALALEQNNEYVIYNFDIVTKHSLLLAGHYGKIGNAFLFSDMNREAKLLPQEQPCGVFIEDYQILQALGLTCGYYIHSQWVLNDKASVLIDDEARCLTCLGTDVIETCDKRLLFNY